MWTRSVLLRLFLIVALLFDGAASAVASVHMSDFGMAAMASQTEPASGSSGSAEMPCHEGGAAHQPNAAMGHQIPPDSDSQSPDCCESGACRCACMHQSQAAVIAMTVIIPAIEHADSVRPMPPAHASPALPHLIRPPIG